MKVLPMPSNLTYNDIKDMEKSYQEIGVYTGDCIYIGENSAELNLDKLKKNLKERNENIKPLFGHRWK